MDEALYACRFVQFAAAMLIFGTASFRIYALAGSQTRAASSILAGFDAWVAHVVLVAAMDDGSARIAHQLNQTGHLLAAGLWLGGLAPLAWVLRQARRQPGDFEISLARDVLRNFSHMGYVAVALIALTGAINTLLLVG